jgi:hypothetical protein
VSDTGLLPEPTVSQRIASGVGNILARGFSRRGVLGRAAVVGAALSVSPFDFVLRPGTAYASVCGPGNTCATGWTAMCCTINNGVNQCPPGSFAGGWWKADSAGLCGGSARYYIDCQGECTGCGCGGSNFCAEGCWNCDRHCASGTCDERRVCWNVFRYGQCNQQIGCSGPVLCRMISCVPPWHFENCTTDAATDNNTTDHNAPCLPQGWTPIQARYTALGGPTSPLGVSSGAEYAVGHGLAQNYVQGRIYQAGSTVHYVLGAVLSTYLALGGPTGAFGFPTSDDIADVNGGHHGTFQNGAYVQASAVGAFAMQGAILQRWLDLGGARSVLAFPSSAQAAGAGGVPQQRFQGGYLVQTAAGTFAVVSPVSTLWAAGTLGQPAGDAAVEPGGGHRQQFTGGSTVYYSPRTPAVALTGTALTAYAALGGGGSVLGYPTAVPATVTGGSVVRCQNGAVYTSAAGSFEVHGTISATYDALGAGGQGALGLPTSNEVVVGARRGVHNTFQNGVISSSRTTGTHVVTGPIATSWVSQGGEDGSLGFPLTDVTGAAGSQQQCSFEGGTLTYNPSTGQVS